MEFFNTEAPAADLIQNDFDNFKDWRVAKIIEKERAAAEKKGEEYEPDAQTGLRTVDLDLNCLNNAMRWAVRKTLLKTNPAASRVHAKRYPLSPWCFPGRARKTMGHVDKSSLTKSLDRLYQVYVDFRKTEKDPKKFPKEPHLTRKYTSHGAGRAFYVLVRRSQGASDPQIGYELNQIGGVGTLEQVYGLPPEHWKNGNAPRLSWIPSGPPAWTKIKDIDFSALEVRKAAPTEGLSFEI